jgi:hypothetical protein
MCGGDGDGAAVCTTHNGWGCAAAVALHAGAVYHAYVTCSLPVGMLATIWTGHLRLNLRVAQLSIWLLHCKQNTESAAVWGQVQLWFAEPCSHTER